MKKHGAETKEKLTAELRDIGLSDCGVSGWIGEVKKFAKGKIMLMYGFRKRLFTLIVECGCYDLLYQYLI